MNTANRRYVFGLGILILAAMLVGTFYLLTQKPFTSAQSDFESYRLLGERVQKDFNQYPLKEIQNDYTITDSLKDGVDIQFANKIEDGAGPDTTSQTARSGALAQVESSSEGVSEPAPNSLSLAFPEDLNEPLAISLPGGKVITVTHNVEESYTRSLLTNSSEADVPIPETKTGQAPLERSSGEVASAERAVEPTPTYVKYTSTDSRINTYYAYQKDQAAG
ncbi:hypothetical protein KC850_02165, partial [Candidatus Kaiserbacteria bacterium]|nr:hypothetical protein [Candidatus Kaiserbacteria bacterium]